MENKLSHLLGQAAGCWSCCSQGHWPAACWCCMPSPWVATLLCRCLLMSQELGVAWHLQSHIFTILVMGNLDGSVPGEGDRGESKRAPGSHKPG